MSKKSSAPSIPLPRPNGNLSAVADIDSVAKLYLINELGKNWDSGVSSTFFTYRQDENGNYKFYGSPVWDYDNSLGNAKGVQWDLRNIGVTDYEEYTGWWCQHKGKTSASAKRSNNVIARISQNAAVKAGPAEDLVREIHARVGSFFRRRTSTQRSTASFTPRKRTML